MPSADFRTWITIERVDDQPLDIFGHVNPSAGWATFARLPCEVFVKGSREFSRLGISRDEVSLVLRTRYSAGSAAITGDMRVSHAGKIYALSGNAYDPDGLRRTIQLEAVG